MSDATANFEITGANLVQIDNATINGSLGGQAFSAVFQITNSAFRFNDYLFNANSDTEPVVNRKGVVATINATSLPFAPKLTVVVGNASANVVAGTDGSPVALDANGNTIYLANTATTIPTPPVINGFYYGVRAEVNPYNLGTIGLNYAQNVGNRSAYGVDYDVKVGPVSLQGVYDLSAKDGAGSGTNGAYTGIADVFNKGDNAFYTKASVDLGIAKVAANYRAIEPAYANGVAGMSPNDTYYYSTDAGNANANTYGADVVGYGGALSTTLGPVTVAAFGDRYSSYNPGADKVDVYNASGTTATSTLTPNASYRTAYGVALGGKLFGLSLTGFYNSAGIGINSTSVHATGDYVYNSTAAYQDTALVPFAYSSTYGGVLKHDGAAADALVKGLNFTVADQYFYNEKANDFQAYGSYAATLGGITVTPFARYHSFNLSGNNGSTFTTPADGLAIRTRTYNAVKYGVTVAVPALSGVIGKPSFNAGFANSITTPGASIAVNSDSKTELYGQAALTLNDIGIANTTASIGYGYWQGFNVGSPTAASSASGGTATFSPTADRFFNSPLGGASDPFTGGNFGSKFIDFGRTTAGNVSAGSVQGVFGQVNFNGLGLNAGYFRYNDFVTPANNSSATAFKVSYTLNF
ncbi:hypothetical protein GCM10008957_37650 [Deinococcus ruber]|uniref:S-layer protein SlpA beta-barrel domain-containing protein n=1 Tax=Deinococcus ruber TaxID=1848197 RepID=A0A918FCI9_9DEIO|nr:hypothetical protein [Deinococcus ruber]GGR21843.1 hypothetical protein GCM10008957_37650 [Deinococcus ruber]